ncbi:hypothetical protein MMC11_002814 [Xylographa trunciseda]|nr:hypothetical protein [Xylographa trunciseda]
MDSQAMPKPATDAPVRDNFSTEASRILASIPRHKIPGLYWGPLSTGSMNRSKLTAEEAQDMSEGFLTTEDSTVFTTMDGEPVIYLLNDAFEACFPPEITDELHAQVISSIDRLAKGYPPKVPKKDDKRNQGTEEARVKELRKRGQHFGDYHFARWFEKGHSSAPGASHRLSKDTDPANPSQKKLVYDFFKEQAPLSQGICMWFEQIDPVEYGKYHKCYTDLANADKLGPLHQSPQGAFTGLVLLLNINVGPHKDSGDVKCGWVATTLEGNWTGGHVIFPELGIKINQKPGSILFARASLLLHGVRQIESGERYCMTHCTKADILKPPPQDGKDKAFKCPACDCGFSTKTNLSRHLRRLEDGVQKGRKEDDGKHNFEELHKVLKF